MGDKKKQSVKSFCEEAIREGKKHGVIMNGLRKRFDKDDATYEKSIKYYASALHRDGVIDDEAKAKYVGSSGRGKTAKANKEAAKSGKKADKKPAEKKPKKADKKEAKSSKKADAKKDKASTKKASKKAK